MKKISPQEFFEKFDESVWAAIYKAAKKTNATHLVRFQNQDMCSSQLGQRTCVCVGPTCTFKSPEDCEGKWINDLPSRRQYPVEFCSVKELMQDIEEGKMVLDKVVEELERDMRDPHKGEKHG